MQLGLHHRFVIFSCFVAFVCVCHHVTEAALDVPTSPDESLAGQEEQMNGLSDKGKEEEGSSSSSYCQSGYSYSRDGNTWTCKKLEDAQPSFENKKNSAAAVDTTVATDQVEKNLLETDPDDADDDDDDEEEEEEDYDEDEEEEEEEEEEDATTSAAKSRLVEADDETCYKWSRFGLCDSISTVRSACPVSCHLYDALTDDASNEKEKEEKCQDWAKTNGCNNANKEYMVLHCTRSCFLNGQFNYHQEEIGHVGFFNSTMLQQDCTNRHDDKVCDKWAESSYCMTDYAYMLENCPKSCMICLSHETNEFHVGEGQKINYNSSVSETLDVIRGTEQYMRDVVMVNETYYSVRRTCRNYDRECSYWAATGECNNPMEVEFMRKYCAPACQTCLLLDIRNRCPFDPEKDDVLKPGDLNNMFERIINTKEEDKVGNYTIVVHSRPYRPKRTKEEGEEESAVDENADYQVGPWVLTFENFLSDEECERFIQWGHTLGYDISTEVSGEPNEHGEYEDIESEYRTSRNTWCQDACEKDPIIRGVMDRITNITRIPETNSESFQLLRYEIDQFYEEHHDYITHQHERPCGPRILTFFLYLNNVEEGGGTTFPRLNITVTPKRGMALLWPSVLDEDPSAIDDRTFHEAVAVKKGVKYGANAWLHLRDYKTAEANDCT